MVIKVQCQCGAVYKLRDEDEGRVFKCKECDQRLVAREQKTPEFDDEERQDVLRRVQESQEATQSRASNPGMMKISKLRYVLAYPKWASIWHIGLLVSLALCVLSLWFILLVAFFVFACWAYWQRATNQFTSGCVNPGKIISVSPPLIAVHTDLRQSEDRGKCEVIKILPQPLHRMVDARAKPGQRIVTVAFYESGPDALDHWQDFDPKLAHAVAANAQSVQRVMDSVDDEDWRELELALKQVPTPKTPGLYRVFSKKRRANVKSRDVLHDEDVEELIETHLQGLRYVEFVAGRLPREMNKFVPQNARQDVVVAIESAAVSADKSEGFALTTEGMFACFSETGRIAFEWADVVGALMANQRLTITLQDGSTVEIPKAHYLRELGAGLEMLCTDISRL